MQGATKEGTSQSACKGAGRHCKAAGCKVDLNALGRGYCFKKQLCPEHLKAEAVCCEGSPDLLRFCQQCGRLQPLSWFEGKKRSCKTSLIKRKQHEEDAAPARAKQQRKAQKQQQLHMDTLVDDVSVVSDDSFWTAEATHCFDFAKLHWTAATAATGAAPPSSMPYTAPISTVTTTTSPEAAAAALADAWCNDQQQQQLQIMLQQERLVKQESSCWTAALPATAAPLTAPCAAAAPPAAVGPGSVPAALQAGAAIEQLMQEILVDQELSCLMAVGDDDGDDVTDIYNHPTMAHHSHGGMVLDASVSDDSVAELEWMIEQELLAAAAETQAAPVAAAAACPAAAVSQQPHHVMGYQAPMPFQQQLVPSSALASAAYAAATAPCVSPAICGSGSSGVMLATAPAAAPPAAAVRAALLTSLSHKAKLQALQLQALQLQNALHQVQELQRVAAQLKSLAPVTLPGWNA